MGSGVIGWAIRRPVTVTVGVILVVLFGVLSVLGLPIQLTPDITVPTITVSTNWPGATPTELEAEILEEQEEALKSLPGLVKMSSEARQGQSTITLELEVGSDLEEALVRASNLLSQVPDYPAAARQPVVSTSNSSGPPLAVLVIQSEPAGRSVGEYGTFVEDNVIPRLERIRGVSGIRLIGGRAQEVHIDFSPAELAARGVSVGQLATAVRGELRDVSAGDLALGKRQYVVRTEVAPPVPEDLENLVLRTAADGTPVRLGDVATVRQGLRKREAVGMMNGSPSMALLLFREAGYNVLEVTREIHAAVGELQRDLLAPEGLAMRVVSDQVGYIEGALDLVQQNLLLGGALAVIVLLIFLRSIRASLVVSIAIPVSVIGTALGMSLMGRTINIVSLAGMAFAVGMVVDNSIVVLEAIDTCRKQGIPAARAALLGTKEVWGAILASTLTTAAVFVPIIGWQDEVGELLRDVAVAISTSVFVSLVVSVLVIPSFSARLLRNARNTVPAEGAETGPRGIARPVSWIVQRPLRSLMVAGLGLGLTGWAGLAFLPALEYLPTGNRDIVFGVVMPPPGYSVDEIERVGQKVQDYLVRYTGKEVDGKPALDRSFFVGTPAQAFMGAVSHDSPRMGEVTALVRESQAQIPGVFAFASQASLFGRRLGGGRSIEVDLLSADQVGTIQFGLKLMGALREALPGAQIRPIPGLDFGAAEFRVRPDRTQATRLGLNPAELGLLVDAYVDGAIIGELGPVGEPKRDVLLRAQGLDISDPEKLAAAPVPTPSGQMVPLGRVAKIEETLGPTVIQHIERRRSLTLQVSPPDDIPFEAAIDRVRDEVVPGLLSQAPSDLRVRYSGSAGQLDDAKHAFAIALLLAVLICFLLLAALFEDFLAPITILVSVPLAGAGGVLCLRLVDATLGRQPLDMMTAVGFIILIGVVVNNAILVVDGALARMRDGMPLAEATADAVRRRMRPIAMSVLTSLAGLTPMVLFPGSGSELYRGVGSVVLGGLALSTALTLFIVPAVFSLIWRVRQVFWPIEAPPDPDAA
ncbi:MAG: efflux RND transporter permease subunit [Myxococcales bacterium]|nr:efflux RND transporter permease subunit [Myxococcales bacterium]